MSKMSNRDFVKGACTHCGGHLEYPANAAGQTIPCPHCGQPTELPTPKPAGQARGSWRRQLAIGSAIGFALLAVPALISLHKSGPRIIPDTSATVLPSAPSNTPAPLVENQIVTNNFAVVAFKLDRLPGSSLVYVVGTLRNLSERQRFGVKIEFSLFDTNDNPLGTTTDYQSVIEPRGEWNFKAMVMKSKATSARFNSVVEDK